MKTRYPTGAAKDFLSGLEPMRLRWLPTGISPGSVHTIAKRLDMRVIVLRRNHPPALVAYIPTPTHPDP